MRGKSTQWHPLPHRRRHSNPCLCSEYCVNQELSTPREVNFPTKAALAVGLDVKGLCIGERAGQRTVNHGNLVWEAGGIV